jgi:hypothetical protein
VIDSRSPISIEGDVYDNLHCDSRIPHAAALEPCRQSLSAFLAAHGCIAASGRSTNRVETLYSSTVPLGGLLAFFYAQPGGVNVVKVPGGPIQHGRQFVAEAGNTGEVHYSPGEPT